MKRKQVILSVIGILVALPLLVACAAPAGEAPGAAPVETIPWKFVGTASRGMIHFDEVDALTARDLIAMSNGRLDVEVYGVGEIVEADELFAACKAGSVDMASSWGYHAGEVPYNIVEYQLPMGFRNTSELNTFWYERGAFELSYAVYAEHNLHTLAPQNSFSFFPMYHSNVEIRDIDDIPGIKIRSYGAFAALHEKLGATVIWIPFAELYTAVATGVIDGFSNPTLGESKDMKFYEVCPYLIQPPIGYYLSAQQWCNMDSWNELTPDLQAMIEDVMFRASMRHDHVYANMDYEARPLMVDYGVEFITLPADDYTYIQELAYEVWDEQAAEDPTGRAAQFVAMYKDFMADLGY
jgi:TRAP-type C4-dicarboxylate transport system substrate-binding protein